METATDFIFWAPFWAPKSLQMVTPVMTLKDDCSLKKKKNYDKPRQHIKKQRHYFADKGPNSQSYGFSSIRYGCERWTIKKAEHQRIDAFELWSWRRLLRVPWTARRSNQSILKEINSEYSLGRTDAETETPILWPPDAKSQLIRKDPVAGKD